MNHKKLLLTLTLCLCALLCMVVTASASEVQNTGSHSHALCEWLGDNCTDPAHSEGNHGSVTFEKALTMNDNGVLCIGGTEAQKHNGENYDYILQGGTYYLDGDLILHGGIQVNGSVTLCLNGHAISNDYSHVIQTPSGGDATFTLCDCKGEGKIAHVENSDSTGAGVSLNNTARKQQAFIMYNGCITQNKGSGVYLYQDTSFTMYGGSITKNNADKYGCGGGVYVHSEATFTMSGGEITKNQADYGGGVYVGSETANFTMSGGSITGNHANNSGGGIYSNSDNISIYGGSVTDNSVTKRGKAGGIYVSDSGTLTVGGNVNISGNWKGDSEESGSKNNVYLDYYNGAFATIVIEKKLTGAPIGITTANAPTAGNPVTIVTGNSIEEAYNKHSFQADNAAYGVSYNSTDKVLQLHKHSGGTATCMAKASCETCGEPYGNLAPNNHDLTHHDAQSPTCTETGHTAYSKCDRSGCNYEEGYELIPKLNHAFAAAWEHDDNKHWHKCTRDGCTGVDAEAAHEWQPATYTAPKTCTVCGATQGEPLTRSYYYYAPSAAEDKKDSPKAGDPGVLLYAGLALASLTGLTYTAKKRH